ncbi:GGDEF domain-containing protein [Devosia chinhatensis]|uniref:diguanylate cyclase n=1 Tax=Devosia chinhatensis TaxID=429727 RepID=A0A0F5FNG0_9HYPH|nr:GGDEF domain-containing protein [Devosia chinhatensis]KKB10368.1 hypothetical protein VE26_08375 [Devosia chinhatensis]
MQDILPRLTSRDRIRVALRAGSVVALCIASSVFITFLCYLFLDIPETGLGYAMAVLLPLLLATPICLWLFARIEQINLAYGQLDVIASTDWLTQCLTRRAFSSFAQKPRSSGQGCALLVIDVDHFKRINDQFGHDTGDVALRLIAEAIRDNVRSVDAVGRLGGEEFGVLLPTADHDQAAQVAERIRVAIDAIEFAPSGQPYPLSVSIGAARSVTTMHYEDLFRHADQSLLDAKRAGRNRVCFAAIPA